jgi:hypothetical protein
MSERMEHRPEPKPYRIRGALLVAEIVWLVLTVAWPLAKVILPVNNLYYLYTGPLPDPLWTAWALMTIVIGTLSALRAASWRQAVMAWFVQTTLGTVVVEAAFIGAVSIGGHSSSGDGLVVAVLFYGIIGLPVIVAVLCGAGVIGGGLARLVAAWRTRTSAEPRPARQP